MLGSGDPRVGTGLAAILIATALVYSRSLGNGFVLDDSYEIVSNRHIGEWSFVWKSFTNNILWYVNLNGLSHFPFYRPLHAVWLALNFHLFGLHPAPWHAALIIVHLIVVWLVFRVATILAQDQATGLAAAALFGLMPIHAEAVSWLAAVAPLMSAAFELGAFDIYLSASLKAGLRRAASPPSDPPPQFRLALSLGLYGAALLSYEAAAAFPALIAAHALLLGPHRSYEAYRTDMADGWLTAGARRAIAAAWPYALELTAYLALRSWVLGFVLLSNATRAIAAPELLWTAPAMIVKYTGLLLMPWRAGPVHRLRFAWSPAAPEFYLPAIGIAALCAAGLILLRRDPRRRLHLFCAAWFLIALLPVLGPHAQAAELAIQDRYLYFASAGFCIAAGDLAVILARGGRIGALAAGAAAAATLIVWTVVLFNAERIWRTDVAAYSRCIEKMPEVEFCHNRLGIALAERGRYAAALGQFEAALTLDPSDTMSRYNLALMYHDLGDPRAAARELAEWIAALPHPAAKDYAELALADDAAGDQPGTAAALKRVEALPGGGEIAALTRARLRVLHNDSKGAEGALQELLRRDPGNVDALATLGRALSAEKRYQPALDAYRRAVSIHPQDSSLQFQVALALHNLGRDGAARAACAESLLISPDNPAARALMAEIERGGEPR